MFFVGWPSSVPSPTAVADHVADENPGKAARKADDQDKERTSGAIGHSGW